MIARLKPKVAIPQTNAPVIATERLILRQWQDADIEPNTRMLADPVSARFITSDGKPVTDAFFGWRNAAIMAGHWALHGFGMFAVEAATAAIDWVLAQFTIDQIVHCIDRENFASQNVARRLGASIESEFDMFGQVADVWVTRREAWKARLKP